LPCLPLPTFQEHDGEASSKFGLVKATYGCTSGYLVGALFAAILTCLYRVLEDLEDPFDGEGDDDINWESWSTGNNDVGMYGPGGRELRAEGRLFVRRSKAE